MPPKAGKEVQEVLPTLKTLNINISLAVSEKSLEAFTNHFESLVAHYGEFIELVTKSRLKLLAAEKGLIFDPESLNEKQKKDPKFMQSIQNAPSEMNSELYFKCLQQLVQETVLSKSDPKLLALKQAAKKETKKDSKGAASGQEEASSKNPLNGFDLAFITINLPQNQEELQFFFENHSLLPQLFCFTRQNTIIKESPNFLETLSQTKQHLEDDLAIELDKDFAIMVGDSKQNLTQLNQFQQIERTVQALKDFRSSQVNN